MSGRLVLDSSVLVPWILRRSPAWVAVDALIESGQRELHAPAPVISEVIYICRGRGNTAAPWQIAQTLVGVGIAVTHLIDADLVRAAELVEWSRANAGPGWQPPPGAKGAPQVSRDAAPVKAGAGAARRGRAGAGAAKDAPAGQAGAVGAAEGQHALAGGRRAVAGQARAVGPVEADSSAHPALSLADAMILAVTERLACPVLTRDRYWSWLAAHGIVAVTVQQL